MSFIARPQSPDAWINQIFNAKAAQNGGVVRRKIAWIEAEVGRDLFEAEVKRRGFHCIEAGRQLIVVCHTGPVRFLF